jgi:hypothetical protein
VPHIRYTRLPYQAAFDESTSFYDCLFAGYGAGKTYALVMKMLRLCAINRGLPGGILTPTMQMFKRDVVPTIETIAAESGLKVRFMGNPARIIFKDFNATVYVFHGEDEGRSIRGPNLAWGVINEATLITEKTFKAFLARVRIKAAVLRQIAMSGTPEGFNWAYDMFVAEPREDASVFYGDMRLNRYVADEYAKMLESSYDDIMVGQYVEGKFINTTSGAALYKFNRAKHVVERIERKPKLEVWVNLDFNVAPFAATLWQRLPPDSKEHHKLEAFDEIAIQGGDTWEMGKLIKEKAGTDVSNIVLFPDPAGNARKTSAHENITDIQILEGMGFNDIRYNVGLTVKECLLAANSFVGKNLIRIDRKRCKETVKDFEQVTLKPGTNNLDKKNLARTHWLDGFKNMIEHEWPVEAGAGDWREMQIR